MRSPASAAANAMTQQMMSQMGGQGQMSAMGNMATHDASRRSQPADRWLLSRSRRRSGRKRPERSASAWRLPRRRSARAARRKPTTVLPFAMRCILLMNGPAVEIAALDSRVAMRVAGRSNAEAVRLHPDVERSREASAERRLWQVHEDGRHHGTDDAHGRHGTWHGQVRWRRARLRQRRRRQRRAAQQQAMNQVMSQLSGFNGQIKQKRRRHRAVSAHSNRTGRAAFAECIAGQSEVRRRGRC